ncbi:hypothetical protein MC885_016783 [Smutsia gigantea]|nr:hypothetical protein MC885_016783 [Smutsia gigantea]
MLSPVGASQCSSSETACSPATSREAASCCPQLAANLQRQRISSQQTALRKRPGRCALALYVQAPDDVRRPPLHDPAEPPAKTGPPLVLRKPSTVRAVGIFLMLVLVTSALLQAILYPWFRGALSDVKSSAQLLKGCVDNTSTLGSEIKRNTGGVEATGIQVRMLNTSLNHVLSQIWRLETGVQEASAQIQMLTRSWEEFSDLNTQIPELKRDFDKASALNAKVWGLQSSLESISKLLTQQNDILQMVSQGWKYFSRNVYCFSQIPKTWYSAQQFCMSRDSHLTSATSEGEQEYLYKTAGGLSHWIGLTKAGHEGAWYWVDDTPFNKVQSARLPEGSSIVEQLKQTVTSYEALANATAPVDGEPLPPKCEQDNELPPPPPEYDRKSLTEPQQCEEELPGKRQHDAQYDDQEDLHCEQEESDSSESEIE